MAKSLTHEQRFGRRANLFLAFMGLWLCLIVGRLVQWQMLHHERIQGEVVERNHKQVEIPAPRGEIRDSRGRTLALSRRDHYVILDPAVITVPEETAGVLAQAMGLSAGEGRALARDIAARGKAKRRYMRVSKAIPGSVRDVIASKRMIGVDFETRLERIYPNRWTASHLLGFINRENKKEGLERSLDAHLEGIKGMREVGLDGRGTLVGKGQVIKEPKPGGDVYLTIDANIQFFVEDSIRLGMSRTKAKGVTAIVMDPRSGAILAMANMPDFDPNNYGRSSMEALRNRGVTDSYDPGSGFKIITVAAALDSGRIKMGDHFMSKKGNIKVFDKSIRNFKPFGRLSIPEILWHSSNGGVINIALSMETVEFHDYIQRFGFGRRTQVGLPAESQGIFHPLADWTGASPYFLAMGHEISVTPLQMLRATAAIANNGVMMQPYIAEKLVHADGRQESLRPRGRGVQVVRPEIARQVADALEGVVTRGTAKSAAIPGVRVFGKTGTAQRIIGRRYAKDQFNSSFVGFFPAEAPRYGMIVVVHDPRGSNIHGGDVAAPIFSEIGRKILHYDRGLVPGDTWTVNERTPNWDPGEADQPISSGRMPDLTGLGLSSLLYKLKSLNITPKITGSGRVFQQTPEPGAPIPRGRLCEVVLKEG